MLVRGPVHQNQKKTVLEVNPGVGERSLAEMQMALYYVVKEMVYVALAGAVPHRSLRSLSL